MDKFQHKYRISSARLQNWDYGRNAAYFVTICTANRQCFFGDVYDGEMLFSEIGEMADKFWLEIPDHFPFVKLDAHIVMPNHVHGIIIIDKPDDGRVGGGNAECNAGTSRGTQCRDAKFCVSTTNTTQSPPPSPPPQFPANKFGPQSQNLASIIRGYKTGVTKYARNNNIEFAWQPRFHDHIIRNNASFLRIRNYIINNPNNWKKDKMHAD